MRRHAREQYEEFAEKKADLVARARTQREWSSQGVRNAMRKSPDNDRIRRTAFEWTILIGGVGAVVGAATSIVGQREGRSIVLQIGQVVGIWVVCIGTFMQIKP